MPNRNKHMFPDVSCISSLCFLLFAAICIYLLAKSTPIYTSRNLRGSRTGPPRSSTAMEDFDDEAWTRTCQFSQLPPFASTKYNKN